MGLRAAHADPGPRPAGRETALLSPCRQRDSLRLGAEGAAAGPRRPARARPALARRAAHLPFCALPTHAPRWHREARAGELPRVGRAGGAPLPLLGLGPGGAPRPL